MPKTHFKARNLLHLQNAIKKLKSGGEITIRSAIVDCAGNEIAIGVHCDDGDILTQGDIALIGIFGFVREKANGGITIRVT